MPKLVNRGPAGLLKKLKKPVEAPAVRKGGSGIGGRATAAPEKPAGKINRFPAALRALAVDVASLRTDPRNARLHPERNLEAIKASLSLYGQLKPVVVRRGTGTILAGNGTYEAARALGWTKIAAVPVEMDDATAAGYGVADNRTAELASWDWETLSALEALVREAGGEMIGWTSDELEALRTHGFVEPPEDFPEFDEEIETEHQCPKCGYRFSGSAKIKEEAAEPEPPARNGRRKK